MTTYVPALVAVVVAFFIGMLLSPAFMKLSKKIDSSQTILSYVEQHKGKEGIPTMGGIVFIMGAVLTTLIFGGHKGTITLVMVLIFFAYGIIGFLDDIIKVKYKRNMGLRAYQKIISQLAVAGIAGYYAAKSPFIGTSIALPVTGGMWELGGWYIPFAIITFVAMTNSVNLTDGLDGLAGTVNVIYFSAFLVIIFLALGDAITAGNTLYQNELYNMSIFIGSVIGGLMAFLWFNTYKARFFMGDTGALALGGTAAAVGLFIKNPLISILIGITFVISSISVIVQVIYFKMKKKRVFLMSPFHHHLELKGYNEGKIVSFYGIVTAIAGVVSVILIII